MNSMLPTAQLHSSLLGHTEPCCMAAVPTMQGMNRRSHLKEEVSFRGACQHVNLVVFWHEFALHCHRSLYIATMLPTEKLHTALHMPVIGRGY